MEPLLNRKQSWIGISAILGISALFTVLQIRHSLAAGRLADPPTWDDVVYLDDAAIRLHEIQTQPFGHFLTAMVQNPPHSLYSVAMATLGFYCGGIRDWVPYATNGLWLVALLFSVRSLIRRSAIWQTALLFAFVLTMPLVSILITEYRPDLPWGVSSAMAVFSVLRWRWVGSSRRHQLATGLWFAAALICKTSTFPLTLMTVGIAWLLAIACDRAERPTSFTPKNVAATVLWASLPTLLIAVPYYAVEAKPIFGYIFQTLLGPDRNRWIVQGTWLDRARYFLDGGGKVMLRNHFYLLAVILIAGGLLWIKSSLTQACPPQLRRGLCIAAVTFIAYFVPALNPVKNPFFGAEFQFLLLLSAIALIDALVASSERSIRHLGNGILIAASLTGLGCYRFPAPVGTTREPDTSHLVQVIVSTAQNSSIPQPKVFLAVIGRRLNTSTLDYVSRQTGKHISFTQPAYNATIAQITSNLDQYDFIVAGETGVGDVINPWTPNQLAGETLAIIEADPNFKLSSQLETRTNKRLFIYRHLPRATPP
jgi:hypothetical protein